MSDWGNLDKHYIPFTAATGTQSMASVIELQKNIIKVRLQRLLVPIGLNREVKWNETSSIACENTRKRCICPYLPACMHITARLYSRSVWKTQDSHLGSHIPVSIIRLGSSRARRYVLHAQNVICGAPAFVLLSVVLTHKHQPYLPPPRSPSHNHTHTNTKCIKNYTILRRFVLFSN